MSKLIEARQVDLLPRKVTMIEGHKKYGAIGKNTEFGVLALAWNGFTAKKITEALNISGSAVYKILGVHDIAPKPANRISSEIDNVIQSHVTGSEATLDETYLCIECGVVCELTSSHRNWYEEKELELPKRCNSCVIQKKARYPGDSLS